MRASLDVLEAIARALRLTPAERAHLILLGRGEEAPACKPPAERVSPTLRRLIENLGAEPGVRARPPLGLPRLEPRRVRAVRRLRRASPRAARNHLWQLFMDPARRELFADWERLAAPGRGQVPRRQRPAPRRPCVRGADPGAAPVEPRVLQGVEAPRGRARRRGPQGAAPPGGRHARVRARGVPPGRGLRAAPDPVLAGCRYRHGREARRAARRRRRSSCRSRRRLARRRSRGAPATRCARPGAFSLSLRPDVAAREFAERIESPVRDGGESAARRIGAGSRSPGVGDDLSAGDRTRRPSRCVRRVPRGPPFRPRELRSPRPASGRARTFFPLTGNFVPAARVNARAERTPRARPRPRTGAATITFLARRTAGSAERSRRYTTVPFRTTGARACAERNRRVRTQSPAFEPPGARDCYSLLCEGASAFRDFSSTGCTMWPEACSQPNRGAHARMRTLARTCFVHRRLVVLGWIVAIVGVTLIHGAVGSSYSDNFKLPHTQSFDAIRLLQRNAPKASGDTDQLVIGGPPGQGHRPGHPRQGRGAVRAGRAAAARLVGRVAVRPRRRRRRSRPTATLRSPTSRSTPSPTRSPPAEAKAFVDNDHVGVGRRRSSSRSAGRSRRSASQGNDASGLLFGFLAAGDRAVPRVRVAAGDARCRCSPPGSRSAPASASSGCSRTCSAWPRSRASWRC